MSPAKDQSRLHGRRRGEVSAPRTVLKKAAALRSTSQRLAVTAGVVAVLLGAGAAGQAADQAFEANRTSVTTPEAGATTTATATPSATPSATPWDALKPDALKAAAKPATPKAAPKPAPVKVAAAPKPAVPAKPAPVNDPAGAQAYAASLLSSFGWGPGEMDSLRILWTRESNWTTTATNASSGAYGIVQSLPGDKMATEGADWQTNYRTQIRWGLNYIKERYGSPSAALSFHYANNWY